MANVKNSIIFILLLNLIWCNSGISIEEKPDLKFAQRTYRSTIPGIGGAKPETVREKEAREKRWEIVGGEVAQEEEEAKLEFLPGERRVAYGAEPTELQYRVAVNDRLFISVWRANELSLEFIIGPDGLISFPLIGDIRVAGKTLTELDSELTEKLKEYVHDPQVSAMIREFAGDKVTVIGEIKSPGIYKFIGKTNIIDVIAIANGFTEKAKIVGVAVIRQPKDPERNPELIFVNTKSILKGELRNIEVQPNDIVYVSRTFVANLEEFYDNWLSPLLGSAIDYETYLLLRRKGIKRMY